MAEITFTDGLPAALHSGLGFDHVDTVLRTEMASGRQRRRERFTGAPSRVSVSWLLNSAQVQLFEARYWAAYNESNPSIGGIQAGTMPFKALIKTPLGRRLHDDVTFYEKYRGPTLIGPQLWKITATLEIRERPVLPPSSLEFPEYILYSGIIDIVATVKWPPQT